MPHFIGLHENGPAKDLADTWLLEVWNLHELLTEMIAGVGPDLSGELLYSLCKMLGVKKRMSTAYHPQTNRQTERNNQVLEGHLRTFVKYDENDGDQLLPLAKHANNNSATNANKMSPFFANYPFHPQR